MVNIIYWHELGLIMHYQLMIILASLLLYCTFHISPIVYLGTVLTTVGRSYSFS
jgi:hypothetical protein